MNPEIIQRPSVPSSLFTPDSGNGQIRRQAEGAKNLWATVGCHTRLHIATYNARTLRTADRLLEMELALERIKWDVIGVSEVRRRGEECLELRSGHIFMYSGDENRSMGGVGLFINKRWASRISHIQSVSDRIVSKSSRHMHQSPHMKMRLSSVFMKMFPER